MTRTFLHFTREDPRHPRLVSLGADTLRGLVLVHGTTLFGRDGGSASLRAHLLGLPATLLDMPLAQLPTAMQEALQPPVAPAITEFAACGGLQMVFIAMDCAYRHRIITHAPGWLAPFATRVESLRPCTFEDAFVGMLEAREVALRHARDIENACLATVGEPLQPDLHGLPYVDDITPAALLLIRGDLQWDEWSRIAWADIDLARGVKRVPAAGDARCVTLSAMGLHTLQKWYLQCSEHRIVFPPPAGQTQRQHEITLRSVSTFLAWYAQEASHISSAGLSIRDANA